MLKLRKITQLLFLTFFIFLFIKARYPYSGIPESDLFLRFSPLIPVFHFVSHLEFSWVFWPGLIILFFTPLFGRFFCGWICPLGTTLDLTGKLFSNKTKRTDKSGKYVFIKYGLLIALIIPAVFGVQLWGFL